jgi:hypothetical protein
MLYYQICFADNSVGIFYFHVQIKFFWNGIYSINLSKFSECWMYVFDPKKIKSMKLKSYISLYEEGRYFLIWSSTLVYHGTT